MQHNINLHSQWNVDVHYALDFPKWWCKTLGIWPWQRNIFCIVQTSGIILTSVITTILSSVQLLTKGNCGEMIDLLEIMSGIIVYAETAFKVLSLWLGQQQMRYIISSIIDDWSNATGKESRDIMYRNAYWGRLVFILQIAGAVLAMLLTAWIDRPTIIREISQTNRSRNMLLAPSCWVPATMPLSIYLLYYYLFEILEVDIKKINDGDDHLMQRCKIKEYSKRHNQLIELGQHMDVLINIIILTELLSNSIAICATGGLLLVSIQRGTVDRIVMSYAARLYVWYMELLMYCYVGEKLSSHADKLRSALYDCAWYNMSKDIVKDMIFMIIRNNVSCRLTGGHFFVMNHESFAKITKIMFSFLSVLRFMLQLN
ncbi:uncharacterized protein LOC135166666 isoform X2 [Diachasmimorpha longicaudata]|uniref:uncharacterized protein LOC135166666 isoform X2 n=1 Tax=Diachasmimorpha longicaudata TaxID=58733 RepID=UPI0030B89D78